MSIETESQPNMRPTPPDERDELAKLEAKLAKKQIEVKSLEDMGAFDSGVVSNEGEVNYQEYLESRPDDGTIRDGEDYRDVKTGQFSSQESYFDQTAPKNEILDMLKNPGEQAEVDYSTKSRTELIKLAADAKVLGDRAELEDIRAAFEQNLMEEFTREIGAGMTEEEAEIEKLRYAGVDRTDEQFNAELAAFDSGIDKMLELRDQKNNADSVNAENTSNQGDSDKADDDQEQSEETAEKDSDSAETEAELELNIGDRVTYRDREGNTIEGNIVADIDLDNENYKIFGVETEDGTIQYVSYAELVKENGEVIAGEPGSEGEALEGESLEEYESRMAIEAKKDDGSEKESVDDSAEILKELNDTLQEAQDKYAEATAKHRNGFMGHLLHNSRFIAKIPLIGKLLKGAADKLNEAQDSILLGPARTEYKKALLAIQNEIKDRVLVEFGDGPEAIDSIRMQASDAAIQSEVQLEMKIAALRMERSGTTNKFMNWWVRQNGLGGKFMKAGIIVGAGLTAGAILGLAGAPIIAGTAFGAGMGAGVGLYATKKRASAITTKGGSETLAQVQGQEDIQRKSAYARGQMESEDGFTSVADLVSMTEDRTGNEKVGNRRRVKSAAGAGALGGTVGASIGSAIRSSIESGSGTSQEVTKQEVPKDKLPADTKPETVPDAPPAVEIPQHDGISILNNEGGTQAIQRLYGASEDQARSIWNEVFNKFGTSPLDHTSVGGPSMPDIIQLPGGSYGWSHEGWLSSTMSNALNEAAKTVMG